MIAGICPGSYATARTRTTLSTIFAVPPLPMSVLRKSAFDWAPARAAPPPEHSSSRRAPTPRPPSLGQVPGNTRDKRRQRHSKASCFSPGGCGASGVKPSERHSDSRAFQPRRFVHSRRGTSYPTGDSVPSKAEAAHRSGDGCTATNTWQLMPGFDVSRRQSLLRVAIRAQILTIDK